MIVFFAIRALLYVLSDIFGFLILSPLKLQRIWDIVKHKLVVRYIALHSFEILSHIGLVIIANISVITAHTRMYIYW